MCHQVSLKNIQTVLHSLDENMYQFNMTTLRWSKIAPWRDACHIAYVDQSTSSGWMRHDHDYCEIFRVDSGKGWHWHAGAERPLSTGQLVFVRARDRHGFRAEHSSEPFAFINVAFPIAAFSTLATRYGLSRHHFLNERAAAPPVLEMDHVDEGATSALFQEVLHAPRTSLTLDWLLLSIARLTDGSVGGRSFPTAPAWLRGALLKFARDPELLNHRPAYLAGLAGCSLTHLSRACAEHLHQTPTAWILHLRTRRAALLLETTTYRIAEVALMSGFENLSNFHRRFLAEYGSTPRLYRKRKQRRVT